VSALCLLLTANTPISVLWVNLGLGGGPHPPTTYFSGRGSPPHPCAGAGGGHPLPPPVRNRPPSPKMRVMPVLFSSPEFHAKRRSGLCKKEAVLRTKGGGGDPPTPLPYFFEQGITPHPMSRGGWGAPLLHLARRTKNYPGRKDPGKLTRYQLRRPQRS